MPNVPDDVQIPAVAVTPARPISVETHNWQGPSARHEGGTFPVLAIGWYAHQNPQPEPFAYLVHNKLMGDVFWVGSSLVDRVISG